MMTVGCGDVNDIDVGVGDELSVRAIQLGRSWSTNLLNEAACPVGGAGRGDSYNLVADVGGITARWVVQEVLAES